MERIKEFIRTAQQFFSGGSSELKKVLGPPARKRSPPPACFDHRLLVAFYLGGGLGPFAADQNFLGVRQG